MNEVLMIPAEEMDNLMNLYNQSKSISRRERVQVEQQKQLSSLEPHLAKKPFPYIGWMKEDYIVAPLPHSNCMDYHDLLTIEL